jgi:hypothetical protein
MTSKYDVVQSEDGGCCICSRSDEELYLARQVESGEMNALCSCCLLDQMDKYVIDNTRPWPMDSKGEKGGGCGMI